MATTVNDARAELAQVEREAAAAAAKASAAADRLARLRAEREAAKRERLAQWARATIEAYREDRAAADRAVADAGQAFGAAVESGDLNAALAAYLGWAGEDAARLAVAERFNTARNHVPPAAAPAEIISMRASVPEFVAALTDAARGVHLRRVDSARADVLREYRRLVDGDEEVTL